MPKKVKTIGKVSEVKPKTDNYSVNLVFGEYEYKADAPTIVEALEKLEIKLMKCIGKLHVIKGDKQTSITIYPRQVRKFKVNKFSRLLLDKRLNLLLK